MAKMKYAYPIEEVHGKLKGKFGVAMRTKANAKGEREGFSVNYGTRSTTPSTAEVARRTKFGTIGQMAAARKANPTKREQDAAGFKAQSTYTTLNQYVWRQALAEYNAQHS